MKIYNHEKQDGLEEAIKASASIAMACKVLPSKELTPSSESVVAKILASSPSNPDQRDLYYLNSVLVSTGWNKNDDVFDPEETWAARNTPVDKQFNFMHDENDIIGHITGSVILDENGDDISGQQDAPEEFDIITSAVVYKSWSDKDKDDRINKLTQEIDEGKWAVSMECLFTDFDYAVVTPDGQHKVLARDEESSFLTKHLRCYGGTGKFDNFTIGRQLKNITFSGKGLVDNPANPKSIILDKDVEPFKAESEISIAHIQGETNMDLETLKARNAELEAKLEEVQAEINDAAKAEFESRIEALESSVAEKDVKISDLEKQVAELTDQVEAKDKENKKFKEDLEKVEEEKKAEKRKAALVEAGMTSADAVVHLEKFAMVDDTAFEAIVKMVADQAKAEDQTEAEVDEEVEAEAEAEADKDDLDETETTEASLADAGEDADVERSSAIEKTSEWLSGNVLKSTRTIKQGV